MPSSLIVVEFGKEALIRVPFKERNKIWHARHVRFIDGRQSRPESRPGRT
jgi:hypothetical protein